MSADWAICEQEQSISFGDASSVFRLVTVASLA
jgi:hypothetical protein